MESLDESMRKAVDIHLPGRAVLEVKDRGEWLRRLVGVTLDGNEKVFFKISIHIGEPGRVPLETGLGGQRFFYEQGFLFHGSWRSMIHAVYLKALNSLFGSARYATGYLSCLFLK